MQKTTPKRTLVLATAVGGVCLLAFGLVGVREWWLSLSPPSREPDIYGRVIAEGAAGYLVESPHGGRCWFRPPVGTSIRTRNDEPAALAVGQTVSGWHTNIVKLTDPPQVDAVWIIIEPDEPKAQQP